MRRYRNLCSKNSTGLLSRIADFNRPFASYGVAGQTTFSPGVCTKYISGFPEWNGPPCTPPPHGPRTTIGTGAPQR